MPNNITQCCAGAICALLTGMGLHAPSGQCADSPTALKVDISQDNGRRDILAPDCKHWRINETHESSIEIEGLNFAIRSVDPSTKMLCDWWKKGFENPATLASDGVVLKANNGSEAILEMRIRGLKPGNHSIVSVHNFLQDDQAGHFSLKIDGRSVVEDFSPSRRVLHDDDSGSIWAEFEAYAGRDVIVTWQANAGPLSSVVLNGFVLDVSDPPITKNISPAKDIRLPQVFPGISVVFITI